MQKYTVVLHRQMCILFLPNPPIAILVLPNCSCRGWLTFLKRWCWLFKGQCYVVIFLCFTCYVSVFPLICYFRITTEPSLEWETFIFASPCSLCFSNQSVKFSLWSNNYIKIGDMLNCYFCMFFVFALMLCRSF